jgi:hypothetical protein
VGIIIIRIPLSEGVTASCPWIFMFRAVRHLPKHFCMEFCFCRKKLCVKQAMDRLIDILKYLLASNNVLELTPLIFGIICIAGIVAGIVGAIVGGGGLVVVPTLLALGVPPHVAFATSKMQAIFGSTSSIIQYHRKGLIDTSLFPIAWVLTMFWSIVVIIINLFTKYY